MFQKKVIGSANAIVGGWGNLGGGSVQVLMVIVFEAVHAGAPAERAWRLSFIFPGVALLITAALTYVLGKDTPKVSGAHDACVCLSICVYKPNRDRAPFSHTHDQKPTNTNTPQGDISELAKLGHVPVKASASLRGALSSYMSYVMAIQYAASFGVELVVFNMAASYFHDEFNADIVQAGKIAALCGVRARACMHACMHGLGWAGLWYGVT